MTSASRGAPTLAGIFLIALHVELGVAYGYGGTAGVRFSYLPPSELLFWVSHLLLAIPGLLLLGYGLEPRLGPPLARVLARAVDRRWLPVVFGALLFVLYASGRALALRNQPITDDENMILFGARMLARGVLRVPALEPEGAFNALYTYQRDGFVSSADFVGGLLIRALSLVTRLDGLLYALLSAITGWALAYAAGLLDGRRAQVVAAALFCFSPMGFTLSLTTHAHVASRAFFALAVVFALRLLRDRRIADGAALGWFAGAGFLCRPFEVVALLSPMAVLLLVRAARDARLRRPMVAALVGLAPSLLVFAWYNLRITGVWYLMPRFGPGATQFTSLAHHTPWERVGGHLAFNTLLLIVWFFGPLGATAAVAGIGSRAETRVLAAGIAVALGLTLCHDNLGIHVVGPIHYAECVVPLVLLATLGLLRAWDRLPAGRSTLAMLVGAYLVAMGGFLPSRSPICRPRPGCRRSRSTRWSRQAPVTPSWSPSHPAACGT